YLCVRAGGTVFASPSFSSKRGLFRILVGGFGRCGDRGKRADRGECPGGADPDGGGFVALAVAVGQSDRALLSYSRAGVGLSRGIGSGLVAATGRASV